VLQAALISIDNSDGKILAIVGGSNFKYEKFNRATQALRSPGSTFKAFVYTAAIDNGFTPESIVLDVPVLYEYRLKGNPTIWSPENYEQDFLGAITMKHAFAHSRNVASINLLNQIGINNVINYAKMFGLKEKIPEVPAIAIGGGCNATVLEMTSAYSAFPNRGSLKKSHYLDKVIKRGTKQIIFQNKPEERKVIDETAASSMTEILESVVKEGTGKNIIDIYGFNQPCAGKTGTTDNSTNAWFVGFTPYITTGVWVGYDDNTSIGHKETGAKSALPIWVQVMKRMHENLPYKNFVYWVGK
jgi:penicillin-binding protein 1A